MDVDTLEGTTWDDDLDGLVGAHEVDETGDRGMGEKGQWCGSGYGCGVEFESFECRCTFEEGCYVRIE